MKELKFDYDGTLDIITIEGICYSGNLFRQLGGILPTDQAFCITARKDGVITLSKVEPENYF